jgi:predicted RNase H-like HicB family nuclease
MNKPFNVTVIVEKTGTGFSAYAKEIDGLVTVGDSISELKSNFNEVLYHHVEYLQEQGETSLKVDDFELNYVLDLEQFFEYFNVINKTAFAEQYAKVNSSLFRQYTKGLAPLSGDKLKQISKGLHKLADEINDLSFA